MRFNDNTGTCFSLDIEGKRYLVTAAHMLGGMPSAGSIDIAHTERWLPLPVNLVGRDDDVDVAVLAPQGLIGASHPVAATTKGMTLAEDVYFLGFPFNIEQIAPFETNAGFPLPLVKKGIISCFGFDTGVMLLDGHNNPGFSGGPVVRANTQRAEPVVIGVVTAYRTERQRVLDEASNEGPYTYDTNTGIVQVGDANSILRLVAANPIGIDVP